MLPQNFVLEVTPNPDGSAVLAFHRAWEVLRRGMSAQLRKRSARRVLAYAEAQARHYWAEQRNHVRAMGRSGRFSYWFSDEQGNADGYCTLVPHWMGIVLSQRYAQVQGAMAAGGYTLTTPQPDLTALVAAPIEAPFVVTRDYYASLEPSARTEQGFELQSDLSGPPWEDLSAEEQGALVEVFSRGLCTCALCEGLRG